MNDVLHYHQVHQFLQDRILDYGIFDIVHLQPILIVLQMDRHVDAELAFLRALELAPETPAYLTNLGVCLDRLGRREEAVNAYLKSSRRGGGTAAPRQDRLQADEAHAGAGGLHRRAGRRSLQAGALPLLKRG